MISKVGNQHKTWFPGIDFILLASKSEGSHQLAAGVASETHG